MSYALSVDLTLPIFSLLFIRCLLEWIFIYRLIIILRVPCWNKALLMFIITIVWVYCFSFIIFIVIYYESWIFLIILFQQIFNLDTFEYLAVSLNLGCFSQDTELTRWAFTEAAVLVSIWCFRFCFFRLVALRNSHNSCLIFILARSGLYFLLLWLMFLRYSFDILRRNCLKWIFGDRFLVFLWVSRRDEAVLMLIIAVVRINSLSVVFLFTRHYQLLSNY